MAFRWHADDGPTLNAGLVALWFFKGIQTSIAKQPNIFVIFQWESGPSVTPFGSAHDNLLCFFSNVVHLQCVNRGSHMSAHVLFNLLNELRKRDKMQGLASILSLFRNEFDKLNNTWARMLDSIYHIILKSIKKYNFGMKLSRFVIYYATL